MELSALLGEHVSVILDGDKCWPDLEGKDYLEGAIRSVAALPDATEGGRPVVTIRAELEDGRTVLVQTTMRLFLAAARAFAGRFGELEEMG